jgi:hypothetical protein
MPFRAIQLELYLSAKAFRICWARLTSSPWHSDTGRALFCWYIVGAGDWRIGNLFHSQICYETSFTLTFAGLDIGTVSSDQIAAVTFGRGARHAGPDAPGIEGAITRALPDSIPQGIFGKGMIFYDGSVYEFHYFGRGYDVNVGTYWELK